MRIVVAEDLYLLRDGMVRLIEACGHQVVATAATGPETLEALLTWRPDVAVIDVRMPPTQSDEGLRAALTARRKLPGLPVLNTGRRWHRRRPVRFTGRFRPFPGGRAVQNHVHV